MAKDDVKETHRGFLKNQDGILSSVRRLQLDHSGDYLAFLDDADPIFLSSDLMEWLSEREQKPTSLFKRLKARFKKN